MLEKIERSVLFPVVRTVAIIVACIALATIIFGVIFIFTFSFDGQSTEKKENNTISYEDVQNILAPEIEKLIEVPQNLKDYLTLSSTNNEDYIEFARTDGGSNLLFYTIKEANDFLQEMNEQIVRVNDIYLPVEIEAIDVARSWTESALWIKEWLRSIFGEDEAEKLIIPKGGYIGDVYDISQILDEENKEFEEVFKTIDELNYFLKELYSILNKFDEDNELSDAEQVGKMYEAEPEKYQELSRKRQEYYNTYIVMYLDSKVPEEETGALGSFFGEAFGSDAGAIGSKIDTKIEQGINKAITSILKGIVLFTIPILVLIFMLVIIILSLLSIERNTRKELSITKSDDANNKAQTPVIDSSEQDEID
jgi:hypothetical protein